MEGARSSSIDPSPRDESGNRERESTVLNESGVARGESGESPGEFEVLVGESVIVMPPGSHFHCLLVVRWVDAVRPKSMYSKGSILDPFVGSFFAKLDVIRRGGFPTI